MKQLILSLCMLALLTSCAATDGDEIAARQVLTDFFNHLYKAEYDQAVALYGGDFEMLREWNPEVEAQNFASLWENGCELNGLQCLPIRSATLKGETKDTFVFTVEFNHPDGTLFTLGPCCGEDETQQPTVSQFDYSVQITADGKFQVLDLPVYVP